MTETMNVILPNGTRITDIPVGTTKGEVRDRAIQMGLASDSDFQSQMEESSALEEASSFMQENMEIPVGITAAVTGAAVGAPFGPVGLFVGGVAGGAVGTFGGSLLSDELTGEDLDYAEALDEALISVGFDFATLGAGKALKPAWVIGKRALGFTPKEAAEEIVKLGSEVGTRESLKASQKILSDNGATLTPYQIGAKGWYQTLQEKIANVGILSSNIMAKNVDRVNDVVIKELSDATSGTAMVGADKGQIAQVLFDVVQGGKAALSENYDAAWKKIISDAGLQSYSVSPYVDTLNKFARSRQGVKVNSLSDDTLKYIEDLRDTLVVGGNAKVPLKELATIERKIGSDIAGKFGNQQSPMFNSTVERELGQLSAELRATTARMLKAQDPSIAARYSAMNTAYSEGMSGLLPEINRNFVTQAGKGNYMALGNLIGRNGNIDQIVAFKKSLNTAFREAAKAGKSDLAGVASREQADALIKRGFLETKFPDLATGEFHFQKYATEANKLADKTEARRWKVILGDDYGRVKQVVNLMSEASQKPQSNIGELVFRSKEYQGMANVAAASGGAAAAGIPGAAAVLGIPVFMAKAVTNPKNTNKLLAFENAKFSSPAMMEAAFAVFVSDVLDGMSPEEQAELRNAVRDAGNKPPEAP